MNFTAHRIIITAIFVLIASFSSRAWADCVHSKGYWKNHPLEAPAQNVTLGLVQYNLEQMLAILREPVKGDGLVSLSQQLIAAKLNAQLATMPPEVQAAILSADALIGPRVASPLGTDVLHPSLTSDLAEILDQYNNSEFPCQPLVDTDGDGLLDSDELILYHTDPSDADTDNDLLSDGDEVQTVGTNPLNADTDGDGVTDGEEVLGLFPYGGGYFQTNPLSGDTDGDNWGDGGGALGLDEYPLDEFMH